MCFQPLYNKKADSSTEKQYLPVSPLGPVRNQKTSIMRSNQFVCVNNNNKYINRHKGANFAALIMFIQFTY